MPDVRQEEEEQEVDEEPNGGQEEKVQPESNGAQEFNNKGQLTQPESIDYHTQEKNCSLLLK